MAGQPLLTKADVEFFDLSDYAVSVHLLGASFRQDGALSHPRFCQERRHFSIFAEFSPPLLPVDSGSRMTGSPFFRIISRGLYSDTLAVTWITRSCCTTGIASAAAASPKVAKARKAPIITASLIIFIASAFRDRPLGKRILFPTRLCLHGAEAEAFVRV